MYITVGWNPARRILLASGHTYHHLFVCAPNRWLLSGINGRRVRRPYAPSCCAWRNMGRQALKNESQMTALIIFTVISFIATALVIAACMLSSRLSQREGVQERYESEIEARERRAL